jgi:hypothetical protein
MSEWLDCDNTVIIFVNIWMSFEPEITTFNK